MKKQNYLYERVLSRLLSEKKDYVAYIGIFLDEDSKRELVSWWVSNTNTRLLQRVECDHVTLKFKPTPEDAQQFPIGELAQVRVVGWAADDSCQTVLVEVDLPCANANPHVTVSLNAGIAPVYSNELLSRGTNRVEGPTLSGVVDTFPRKNR